MATPTNTAGSSRYFVTTSIEGTFKFMEWLFSSADTNRIEMNDPNRKFKVGSNTLYRFLGAIVRLLQYIFLTGGISGA